MTENEENTELEAFGESVRVGIEDMLMFLEAAPEIPRPVDPASMGIDDRTIEELTPQEKAKLREVLLKSVGLEEIVLDQVKHREYTSASDTIQVTVFHTDLDDIYLQELSFEDGEIRYMLGPDQNI